MRLESFRSPSLPTDSTDESFFLRRQKSVAEMPQIPGCPERSVPRETDTLVLPQAVPVELWNVAERVVAAGMAIAGEAPKDGQTRQNAHARGCLQRSRERRRVGDRLALEQAGESLARLFWSEHRLLLGGSGTIRTLGPHRNLTCT